MFSSLHHTFDTSLAAKYSIQEAILIHHFQFWIAKNKSLKRNFHDGRTWTFQSMEEIAAVFPYFSRDQIKRILVKLVEKGILMKGNYNKNSYDQTIWYAFSEEEMFISPSSWRNRQMEIPKSPNGNSGIAQPIPDTKTHINKNHHHHTSSSYKKNDDDDDDSILKKIKKKLEKKFKPTIVLKAIKKFKEQTPGKISSPPKWIEVVCKNLKKQSYMNKIIKVRELACKERAPHWQAGKEYVLIASGSIEQKYYYDKHEDFWKKHDLGIKQLEKKYKNL